MKFLVTGFSGQLGYDVVKEGIRHQYEMIGVSSKELDITNENDVFAYINELQPDGIIHCAAYTAVDQSEVDRVICHEVNVTGTKHLAKAAKKVGAKFVYISTDYVFDGQGNEPFQEQDAVNPIGYYGQTKLEGEQVIQALLDKWFIIRISWVFGINGHNFVKTMLRLAETKTELNIVGDQYGSPTYTVDVAKLILDMIETDKYGVYHATNEGYCSWSEFAEEIFRQAKKDLIVHSITTEQYPTKAKRPKNSRMSHHKLRENGFSVLPGWKNAVNRYLKELEEEV